MTSQHPELYSHRQTNGGSSRVPAPLRTRDKPLLTSAWETNPTTHLSIKPRWKLNGAGKVWDELSNYKTLLRVEWEIFTQRRVTRIFLVNNLKYFSIRLFLFQNNSNASVVQLPFITDFQEKVVVLIISFSPKIVSTTNMLTEKTLNSSSRRINLEFISCRVQ